MKFRVTFKNTDVIDDAIKDFTFSDSECDCGLCSMCERVYENKYNDIQVVKRLIELFVKHHECVTIEFDTETMTAVVAPVR